MATMPQNLIESDGTNSPELNVNSSNPQPRVRAIKDALQAFQVATALQNENKDRNLRNARIMAKYNSERPFKRDELEDHGLGWKQNFSTKPLGIIADKASSRLSNAVHALRYFTSSTLPESYAHAAEKSEAFQSEITSTTRSWELWRDYIDEVALETSLFGYTSSVNLDEFSWKPEHFRQDAFFVPKVAKHTSSTAPIIVLKESFKPYDLFELVSDRSAAEAAGWYVTESLVAINEAMPVALRSSFSDLERVYEDLIREANLATSFIGCKEIPVYSVLATEVTGKITHWRVHAVSGEALFMREDRFDSMSEVAHFFSFQRGNGYLHGSKGIGREIYGIAGAVDRARNDTVDRFFLAGKYLITGDEKQLKRFKMHVLGNSILIGSAYNVLDRQMKIDVQDYVALDQFLRGISDEIVGNVSPRFLQGERVTKAQVDLFASREEEQKDNVVARFLMQFAGLMTMLQKKLCDPRTKDKDAKAMQERLLKKMSREELDLLANQPSADVVQDYSEQEQQKIILVATENRGNPLYNQMELERRKVIAQLGESFAKAVLLPANDPTVISEQSRLQMQELDFIARTGQPIPVSPRDDHVTHLELLKTEIESALPTVAQDVSKLPVIMSLIQHMREHIALATQQQDKNVTQYAVYLAELENKLATMQAATQPPAPGAAASPAIPETTPPIEPEPIV